MINKKNKALANMRIGVLGKGGGGKSTITVLLSKVLSRLGYHVCILDADSTNVGLHRALGFKKSPTALIDYFGGTEFSGGLVSCPVDNPTILPKAEISLKKLPAEYYSQKSKITLLVAGKIGNQGPGSGCDGPISKITRDLRIIDANNSLVTLIDVKAGLEDFARGVVTSMDWIITVVDPSIAAIQIAGDIENLVQEIKAGKLPATKHLKNKGLVKKANRIYRKARTKGSFVLLNKIYNQKTQRYLEKKLKEKNIEPIGLIPETTVVSLAWLKGESLKTEKIEEELKLVVRKLEEAIDK